MKPFSKRSRITCLSFESKMKSSETSWLTRKTATAHCKHNSCQLCHGIATSRHVHIFVINHWVIHSLTTPRRLALLLAQAAEQAWRASKAYPSSIPIIIGALSCGCEVSLWILTSISVPRYYLRFLPSPVIFPRSLAFFPRSDLLIHRMPYILSYSLVVRRWRTDLRRNLPSISPFLMAFPAILIFCLLIVPD